MTVASSDSKERRIPASNYLWMARLVASRRILAPGVKRLSDEKLSE